MKKKIVIKVQIPCDKCRSKAMKLAAREEGVDSVAIAGEENNHLVVTGENVDCTTLTTTLRKKVGPADIISLNQVEENKAEEKKVVTQSGEPIVKYVMQWDPNYRPYPQVVVHDGAYNSDPNVCSIM